ncbi:MAG: LytTR family transcriptional regulator DNA-binding domain-containing protein [Bacteroidales bacterium]|nr:LytTR family transcriptional regulator DNA-binding domain-containing protein [Bacteroidales bacterium]
MNSLNVDNIVFIVGDSKECYCFNVNRELLFLTANINELNIKLQSKWFLKINTRTLVNTKHIMTKEPSRYLKMVDGSIHKVSRNKWKCLM